MNSDIVLRTFLLLSSIIYFTQLGNSQVIINEINLQSNWVEIYNTSTTQTVDITNYRLCRRPIYDAISGPDITVLSGSPVLGPGDYVVVEWDEINVNQNELGLYVATGGFGNPANIVDYVQFGDIASPSRAATAVTAGVWDNSTVFVPFPSNGNTLQNFNSAAQSAQDTNSNHWHEGTPTMMSENSCVADYTLANQRLISNIENGNADYETDGAIESNQIISTSAIVDYDSATSILLESGFCTELGATFDALIDGCNQGSGGSHN